MEDENSPGTPPYFTPHEVDPVTPTEAKRSKKAEYQRKYRERKKIDVSGSPEVPDLKSSTHVETSEGGTRNSTRKIPVKGGRKTVLPDTTSEQYAILFQSLHAVGAGVTGVPGLIVTDAEAKPVGEALKVFADFYGWDPIEKFGPVFLLGMQLAIVEGKVIKRVRQQAPEVKRLKAEAKLKRGGGNIVPLPDIQSPTTPPPPIQEAMAPQASPAKKLRLLEELTSQVPETMIPSGIEQGPQV